MTFQERYLLEENNKSVADSVSQWRTGDVVGTIPALGPAGIIPGLGRMHAGYTAGREMGHPITGALFGQEGAAGARSKAENDPTVSIGDVYTQGNVLKRALQGGLGGALVGGLAGGPVGALAGAAGAAGIQAGLIPGARYGIGKLVGGKSNEGRSVK